MNLRTLNCGLAVVFAMAGLAQARVTNLNTMAGYDTIQAAVTAATINGQIIEVYGGTYPENVDITRTLVLRAHAGDTVVVSPTSGKAFYTWRSGVRIEGFEITGPGITHGVHIDAASSCEVVNNYIHDLVTNAVVYGIFLGSAKAGTKVIGNRIVNVKYPTGGAGGHAYGIGADSGTGHIIASNLVSGLGTWGFGISLAHNSQVYDNEITDFQGSYSVGIYSAGSIYCTNSLVSGNYIHSDADGPTASRGIWMDYEAGTDCIFHNNRITGFSDSGAISSYSRPGGTRSSLRKVYSHNIVDTRSASHSCAFNFSIIDSKTNDATVSDNLVLVRNNSASSWALSTSTGGTATTSIRCSNNVFLAAYAVAKLVINDAPGNTYDANFYASNTYVAAAAPYTTGGSVPATDANARGGYWAYAAVPSNTPSTVVVNNADTNKLGYKTQLTYNTAAGRQNVKDDWGAAFVHVTANWRGTNGAPAKTVNLGYTLRFLHRFRDGEVLTTVQLAYSNGTQYGPNGADAASADLYRWNVRNYASPYWELAVLGNVTNAYFPSNDVRRIDGPPDSVLGHYGVETAKNTVWANINYLGELGVFALPAPQPGTVLVIR